MPNLFERFSSRSKNHAESEVNQKVINLTFSVRDHQEKFPINQLPNHGTNIIINADVHLEDAVQTLMGTLPDHALFQTSLCLKLDNDDSDKPTIMINSDAGLNDRVRWLTKYWKYDSSQHQKGSGDIQLKYGEAIKVNGVNGQDLFVSFDNILTDDEESPSVPGLIVELGFPEQLKRKQT